MKLTDKHWKILTQILTPPRSIQLHIDSYYVIVEAVRHIKNPLNGHLTVIVNHPKYRTWNWLWEKSDECENMRMRFCRPRQKSCVRATKSNVKKYGKRFLKSFKKDTMVTVYDPSWPSLSSLKRHLIKNNSSIELTGPDWVLKLMESVK